MAGSSSDARGSDSGSNDQRIAKTVQERSATVVSYADLGSLNGSRADVLQLGDVIEHLPDLNRQMPQILGLIKPGGLLLAQGPLEANTAIFNMAVHSLRSLRRKRIEMAPYHVLLATAKGQRALFRRFGLLELEFSVREVAWPLPERLSLTDLRKPRSVALFTLRRLSQAVSALWPGEWGNRFFYAGRRNG